MNDTEKLVREHCLGATEEQIQRIVLILDGRMKGENTLNAFVCYDCCAGMFFVGAIGQEIPTSPPVVWVENHGFGRHVACSLNDELYKWRSSSIFF